MNKKQAENCLTLIDLLENDSRGKGRYDFYANGAYGYAKRNSELFHYPIPVSIVEAARNTFGLFSMFFYSRYLVGTKCEAIASLKKAVADAGWEDGGYA